MHKFLSMAFALLALGMTAAAPGRALARYDNMPSRGSAGARSDLNRDMHSSRGPLTIFSTNQDPGTITWDTMQVPTHGLVECRAAVARSVHQRYAATDVHFSGKERDGRVRWGKRSMRYRCGGSGINIW